MVVGKEKDGEHGSSGCQARMRLINYEDIVTPKARGSWMRRQGLDSDVYL